MRETDRQTGRDRDRETERQRETETETERQTDTDTQRDSFANKEHKDKTVKLIHLIAYCSLQRDWEEKAA